MAVRLEEFDRLSNGQVRFSQTAGLKQLYRNGDLPLHSVLDRYYAATREEVAGDA
jgi:hypothetical protein